MPDAAGPDAGRHEDDGGHSPEYLALARDLLRLLTNFNFVLGSATLDTRADQDRTYRISWPERSTPGTVSC